MKIDIQPGQKITLVLEDVIVSAEVDTIRPRSQAPEKPDSSSVLTIPLRLLNMLRKGNGS